MTDACCLPVEGTGPIVVSSHERSGTHLLIDVLRRNFAHCRARPALLRNPHRWLYFSLDRLAEDHRRPATTVEADRVLARAPRALIKTHLGPGFDRLSATGRAWADRALRDAVFLYVYRDGRAVMPSYHLHAISERPGTPRGFAEFLRTPVGGEHPAQRWARHVRQWRLRPGVVTVRFEDLVGDTRGAVDALGRAIKERPEPLAEPRPRRNASVWAPRLARATGRLESSNLAERRADPPKWHELFSREDRAWFHEHAGDVLNELGYIDGDGWVDGGDE